MACELQVGLRASLTHGGTMKIRLKKKGFTLIELLIVVAIIGIIAAIAIPNLLNAIQRGRQKRSMADMRSIGTAVEAYAVDNNAYPAGGSSVSNIANKLEPKFIKKMPTNDAWQRAFDYISSPTTSPQEYTIESYGKNGSDETIYRGQTADFNNDIIFSQGSFVEYPEGSQQ
jgi:type II secretion system protein G